MNLLVLEPTLSGHHENYLVRIVTGALGYGHQVTIGTTPECGERLKGLFGTKVTVVEMDLTEGCKSFGGRFSNPIRERAFRSYFGRLNGLASQKRRFDLIFLPYLDYCIHAIGALGSPFGPTPFEGICMRASFHFEAMGILAPTSKFKSLREWVFSRFLRTAGLRRLFTIDESLSSYSAKKNVPGWDKVFYLPDPCDEVTPGDYSQEAALLGIPRNAKTILVYGSIDGRKGIHALINAAVALMPVIPLNVLLAGEQTSVARDILLSPQAKILSGAGMLWQWDRRISESEESALFSSADIVWLGYLGHLGMSGVLVKAAQFGKPVLGCREGLIGWYTSRYELGQVADISDANDVVESVKNIFLRPAFETKAGIFQGHNWGGAIKKIFAEDKSLSVNTGIAP